MAKYMNKIKTYIFAHCILSLNGEISVRSKWFLNILNVTVGTSKQNRL